MANYLHRLHVKLIRTTLNHIKKKNKYMSYCWTRKAGDSSKGGRRPQSEWEHIWAPLFGSHQNIQTVSHILFYMPVWPASLFWFLVGTSSTEQVEGMVSFLPQCFLGYQPLVFHVSASSAALHLERFAYQAAYVRTIQSVSQTIELQQKMHGQLQFCITYIFQDRSIWKGRIFRFIFSSPNLGHF